MRPGPGLVVMALAFISGARRGSTSTSSKTSSSSTSSSPSSFTSSSSTSSSSSPTSETEQPPSVSILFPSFLGGGGVLTPPETPSTHQRERTALPTKDYYQFYHSYHSPPPFSLPDHLRHHYDDPRTRLYSLTYLGSTARSSRETRRSRSISTGPTDDRASDIIGRAGGGDRGGNRDVNIGGDTSTSTGVDDDTSDSSVADSSGNGVSSEGLPVHFTIRTGDASRSFDEDDILALVAEEDLLSEESFDRLTKFKHNKIGYVNEGDYGSNQEIDGEGGGGGGGESRREGHQSGSEILLSDTIKNQQQTKLQDNSHHYTNEHSERKDHSESESERSSRSSRIDGGDQQQGAIYAAKLVSNDDVAALAEVAYITRTTSNISPAPKPKNSETDLSRAVFLSETALARLNPWLSACDLAEPGSAPDLQGQCSAGTLPMAWVDEGPGPPSCPISCAELHLNNNNKNNMHSASLKLNNDNKMKYLINANTFSHKLSNYNNNVMTKIRRDVNEHKNVNKEIYKNTNKNENRSHTAPTSPATETAAGPDAGAGVTAKAKLKTIATSSALPTVVQMSAVETNSIDTATTTTAVASPTLRAEADSLRHDESEDRSRTNNYNNDETQNVNNGDDNSFITLNLNQFEINYNHLNSNSNNNNKHNNNKQKRNKSYNDDWMEQDQPQQHQEHEQEPEPEPEQQQCLEYLGDSDESRPNHLCALKSPTALMVRLRTLRLRHCCERNLFSALHTYALNATLNGGPECERILTDIIDLDALANRITCELAEILFRFDCRQIYSLINQCDDCKEAYRRWVCSTLIPFFAEPSDVVMPPGNKNDKTNNISTGTAKTTTSTVTKTATATPTKTKRATTSNILSTNDAEYELNANINNYNNKNKNVNNKHNSGSKNNKNYNVIISDSNKLINGNFEYEGMRNKRQIQIVVGSRNLTSLERRYYDVMLANYRNSQTDNDENNNHNNKNSNNNSRQTASNNKCDFNGSCAHQQQQEQKLLHRTERKNSNNKKNQKEQQQQQSNNFISTANSKDPSNEDPVISKLLKRSKRKVEFRKRRRIRPCLNVCQTVEQKCPYLLPADRAPALPTQYAGEPTFSCLDPNIPETGEQYRKSNYGPPDCCYTYCGYAPEGVCTYCTAFATQNTDEPPVMNITKRVHNITLNPIHQHQRLDGRSTSRNVLANDTKARTATISVALRNISSAVATLEQMPYYAYFEGTYYYDEDIFDMPKEAATIDCPPVPSVINRCSIPYYASSATTLRTKRLQFSAPHCLLWFSAILCVFNSYNAATTMARRRHKRIETEQQLNQIQRKPEEENHKRTPHLNVLCPSCVESGREANHNRKRRKRENANNFGKLSTNAVATQRTTANSSSVYDGCSSRNDSDNRFSSNYYKNQNSRIQKIIINKFNNRPVQTNKNIIYNNKFRRVNFSSKFKFYRSKKEDSSKISTCNIKINIKIYSNKINNNNNYISNNNNNYKNDNGNNKKNNYKNHTHRYKTKDKNNSKEQQQTKNIYHLCCNKNYRFFYYYNFNINDWWRRWWIRSPIRWLRPTS